MGDHQHSETVDVPASQLFHYLADVQNLPRYFSAMTNARPGDGDAVYVHAQVHGESEEGQAWFRVDHDARALAWGSEGANNYHGELSVTGDEKTSTVTLKLHTERADGAEVDEGVRLTLASVKSLVEDGSAPGPFQTERRSHLNDVSSGTRTPARLDPDNDVRQRKP